MKKIFLFTAALVGLVLLTSCDSNEGTWQSNADKRWWAGEDDSELWGFIDEKGKLVIPAEYYQEYYFSCGWARVTIDTKGNDSFIDTDGKEGNYDILPDDNHFYYNRIRFKENGKKGMYDENFKVVIPADYNYLGYCADNGLIYFSEDGKEYGYMDKDGKVVIEEQFDYALTFADGIAVVEEKIGEEWRYGIIDKSGKFLLDYQKKALDNMGEGRVWFKKDGKYGMMDKNGNEILSAKYDYIDPFTSGLARVKKNGKWGFINKNGEEVVSCRYYSASNFYDDVAWVKKNSDSRDELLDTKGETVLTLKENEGWSSFFTNGLCLVYNNNKKEYRYINKKGETIYKWTPKYSESAPQRMTPAEREARNREFILSTEYGPLFQDMMRRTK